MNDLTQLLDWLRAAPPGTQIEASYLLDTLTRISGSASADRRQQKGADPTIQEVAEELGRSPSTVRGWRLAGEFPNAYQLKGKEWRVPRSDIAAFLERQKVRPVIDRPVIEPASDLGSWRNHFKGAA